METFEELKALARSFIEREVRDRLPEYEAKEEFPWPLVWRMAELGFLGVIVPQAYGGVGLGYAPYFALLEEMGAYASLRSVMSVQQSLVAAPILAYGNEEQKRAYLPRLARGEILGAYALTEPGAGSDAATLRTRA